jgi:PKHD-type hydroxylase
MILTVRAIDDAAALEALGERIDRLRWRDGRATAGTTAKAVKRNLQAVLSDPDGESLQGELKQIIADNPVVKAAAQPRRFSRLIVSRTQDEGHYGAHVDNALMGKGEDRMRTDISFTLFLNPPEEYEGGELVIHAAGMTQSVKPQAGEIVLYPSSSIHEVRPVTRGVRAACVGWIESWIADPGQREMLFDLENLRVSLRTQMPRQSAELLTLDKTIANLVRMWGRR